MATNSKYTSKYLETPIKDFYLDIWAPIEIESTPSDPLIEITPKYNERPDLLAFDLYGTPNLWWVFAIRNPDNIIDPITDFVSGTLIFTPTKETIDRLAK
jgi:hypothetical protein